MKTRTLKSGLAFLLAGIMPFLPMKSSACTGAKQSAMGDTGVSYCDNANTVYWNQGRLALLKNPELSFLQKFGNMDDFRYDTVINFAMPLGEKFGIGVQYIDSETKNTNQYGTRTEDWKWLKLGIGGKVYDKKDGRVVLGTAITPKTMTDTTQYRPEYENGKRIKLKKDTFDFEISAGIESDNNFVKGDTLRFGALMRSFGSYEGRHFEGYRPEFSYTLPNEVGDFTAALGYYNLLGPKDKEGNSHEGIRAGIEQKIGKNFALRAGYIDYGESKDITCGIGYQGSKFGINLTSTKEKDNSIEVSYKF